MHNGLRVLVEAAEGAEARSLCSASWVTFRRGGESVVGSARNSLLAVECAEPADWRGTAIRVSAGCGV